MTFTDEVTPWGFPETTSKIEIEMLKLFFTPEQARTYMYVRPVYEPVEIIAKRMELPPEKAIINIDECVERGTIVRRPKENAFEYRATPFVPGIVELNFEILVENIDIWLKWDKEVGNYHSRKRTVDAWRVLPIDEVAPSGSKVLSYEQISEFIENAPRPRAVLDCMCRGTKEKASPGSSCGRPIETCITFGGQAQFAMDKKKGRELNDQEFRDILRKCEEAGLVHLLYNTANFEDATWLCNCCRCCCDILQHVHKFYPGDKIEGGATPSSYIAEVDTELCSGCETCIDNCQFHALEMKDDVVSIIKGKCHGCGICASLCPGDAFSMVKRKEGEIKKIPVDDNELIELSRFDKNL